jgi:hypothetical protein
MTKSPSRKKIYRRRGAESSSGLRRRRTDKRRERAARLGYTVAAPSVPLEHAKDKLGILYLTELEDILVRRPAMSQPIRKHRKIDLIHGTMRIIDF